MPTPSETAAARRPGAPFRWRPLAAAAGCALLLAACTTDSQERPLVEAPPPVSPEVVIVAERAIEQGRHADAKLLLERVLLSDPANLRARLAMAEIQLAFRNLDAADKGFMALTELPEVSARALQGHGLALHLKGQPREAQQALLRAVEQDPGLWRAWNALGSLHDRSGDWDQATAAYDRALALNPESAMLYNNRGFSYLLRRDAEAAIADFDMALKLDPKMEAARENLRLAFAWTGQYEQALLGVAGKDIGRAYNNIGFVALLRGDLPTAEAYLLRSMEADPKFNRVANRNLEYLRSLKAVNEAKREGRG
jgi:Flp pilus assembly protein TadD